jgi:hypothetical protein
MEAAMDLMRRMPPGSAETALNALLSLLPDHSLDLLSQVDLPLQVYPLTPFPPAPLGSDRIGGAGAFRFVVLEIDRAWGFDAPPAGAYVSFDLLCVRQQMRIRCLAPALASDSSEPRSNGIVLSQSHFALLNESMEPNLSYAARRMNFLGE